MPQASNNGTGTGSSLAKGLDFWNISDEEAARQLLAVPEGREFHLHGNGKLNGLESLLEAFHRMDAATFSHHVTNEKDDFIRWMEDVTGCGKFTTKLKTISREKKTSANYSSLLEKYITMLKTNTGMKKIFDLREYSPTEAFRETCRLFKNDTSPSGEFIKRIAIILSGDYPESRTWKDRLRLLETIQEQPPISAKQRWALEILKEKVISKDFFSQQKKIVNLFDKFQQKLSEYIPKERGPLQIEISEYDLFLEKQDLATRVLIDNFIEKYDKEKTIALLGEGLSLKEMVSYEAYISLLNRISIFPNFASPDSLSAQIEKIRDHKKKLRESIKEKEPEIIFGTQQSPLDSVIRLALKPLFKNKKLEERLDSKLDRYSWRTLLYLDALLSTGKNELADYISLRLESGTSAEEAVIDAAILILEEKEISKKTEELIGFLKKEIEKLDSYQSFLEKPAKLLGKKEYDTFKQLKDDLSKSEESNKSFSQEYLKLNKSEIGYQFSFQTNLESLLGQNKQQIKNLEKKAADNVRTLTIDYKAKVTSFLSDNAPEKLDSINKGQEERCIQHTDRLNLLKGLCETFGIADESTEIANLISCLTNHKEYFTLKLKIKEDLEKDAEELKRQSREISKRKPAETIKELIETSPDKTIEDAVKEIGAELIWLGDLDRFLSQQKQKYLPELKTSCLKTELADHAKSCEHLYLKISAEIESTSKFLGNVASKEPQETKNIVNDAEDAKNLLHKLVIIGKTPFVESQGIKEKQQYLQKLIDELTAIEGAVCALTSIAQSYEGFNKTSSSLFSQETLQNLKLDEGITTLIDIKSKILTLEQEAESALKAAENCSRKQYLNSPIANYNRESAALKEKVNEQTTKVIATLDRIIETEVPTTTIDGDINFTLDLIEKTKSVESFYSKLGIQERAEKAKIKQQNLKTLSAVLNLIKSATTTLEDITNQYKELNGKVDGLFSQEAIRNLTLEKDIVALTSIQSMMQKSEQEASSAYGAVGNCSRKQYIEGPVSSHDNELSSLKDNIKKQTAKVVSALDNIVGIELQITTINNDIKIAAGLLEKIKLAESFYSILGFDEGAVKAYGKQIKLENLLKELNAAKTATFTFNAIGNVYTSEAKKIVDLFNPQKLTALDLEEGINAVYAAKAKFTELEKTAEPFVKLGSNFKEYKEVLTGYSNTLINLQRTIDEKINLTLITLDKVIATEVPITKIDDDITFASELIEKTKRAVGLYQKLNADEKAEKAKAKQQNLQKLLEELTITKKVISVLDTARESYKGFSKTVSSLFSQETLNNLFLEKDITALTDINSRTIKAQQEVVSSFKSTENCSRKQYLNNPVTLYNQEVASLNENIKAQAEKAVSTLDSIIETKVPNTKIVNDINFASALLEKTRRAITLYPLFGQFGIDISAKRQKANERCDKLKIQLDELNSIKETIDGLTETFSSYDLLLIKPAEHLFGLDISKLEKESIDQNLEIYKQITSNLNERAQAIERISAIANKFSRKYSINELVLNCLNKQAGVGETLDNRIELVLAQINANILTLPSFGDNSFKKELELVEHSINQSELAKYTLWDSSVEKRLIRIAAKTPQKADYIDKIRNVLDSNIRQLKEYYSRLDDIETDRTLFAQLKQELSSNIYKLENAGKKWWHYTDDDKEEDKKAIQAAEKTLLQYHGLHEKYKNRAYLEDAPSDLEVSIKEYAKFQTAMRDSTINDTKYAISEAKKRVVDKLVEQCVKKFNQLRSYNPFSILETDKIIKIKELTAHYDAEIKSVDSSFDSSTLKQKTKKYIEKQIGLIRYKLSKTKDDMSQGFNYTRKLNLWKGK